MHDARRRRPRRPEDRDGARAAAAADHPLLALQRAAGNQAVTRVLARDPQLLQLGPSANERMIEQLDEVAIADLYRQFKLAGPLGPTAIDVPTGCFPLAPGEGERLWPLVQRLKETAFQQFAFARFPLYVTMLVAPDAAARHTAIAALRAFDVPWLPKLTQMRDALGGTWDIDDPFARDAVLAAIQLEAATQATDELSGDTATIRARVTTAGGMGADAEWCGLFAADHYATSRMDDELRTGFIHTIDVEGFFTYVSRDDMPKRVKRWVWNGTAWQSVHDFHAARGSLRTWLTEEQVVSGGVLDIRPGDTVLIDLGADGGPADHIAMAVSYDAATSTLVTIGGNDTGYTVRPKGAAAPPADDARAKAEAATGLDLQSPGGFHVGVGAFSVAAAAGKPRGVVYGIGRPSLVDFEEHRYAAEPLDKPPPPLAGH